MTVSRPRAPVAVPAATLERQYVTVVRQIQPQVVQIRTDGGLGSGIVFDTKGHIVTNAHVVAGASSLSVTLADGRRFAAQLVGAYVPDDLAVISIGSGHAVTPATFADSSKVEVGDLVLAVGNPLGLQSSVTDGIVSGVGRDVSEGQGVVLPNAIQTSAPINPGNSGGALVDLQGQVVGIPTLAASNPQIGGTAAGIGFAVPSNVVSDIAGQIVRTGRVENSHRAALGVSLSDNPSGGAVVAAVKSGGAAAKAGIAVGDTIQAIKGT
ncbi:MAG TPA: trypsin-like peptidase domain-containing protein, partial [Solirubrobacteraceae bacterium]|nr:trypsin-like peptidase domain-containing protein [Solirubrobacteraceae bacterium]